MEFLVSWKGFSSEADSWEPYKGVCKTQAFVGYCLTNILVSRSLAFPNLLETNEANRYQTMFNPPTGDNGPNGYWNLMQDSPPILEVCNTLFWRV